MGKSKRAQLEEKTVAELRAICKDQGITGMTKKRKDVIIDALMETRLPKQTATKSAKKSASGVVKPAGVGHTAKLAKQANVEPVTRAEFQMSSVLTKPSAKAGDKCTTAIQVSCGAASGKFPVIGKTVGAVAEFLREVLNVDRLAEGMVNGDKVEGSYVLKEGDTLEFLKPAGQKG